MSRSRKILALGAFVALSAWANAQAMACCRLPARAENASHSASHAASSSHSCCPGEASTGSASPKAPANAHGSTHGHACGSETTAHPALGCGHDAAPAEGTSSVTPGDVSHLSVAVPCEFKAVVTGITSTFSPDSGPPGASGSPRYLALRRILI